MEKIITKFTTYLHLYKIIDLDCSLFYNKLDHRPDHFKKNN